MQLLLLHPKSLSGHPGQGHLGALYAIILYFQQSAAEIVHIPIFTITPTNVLFLTPPYTKVYPTYDGKLIPDSASLDLFTLTSQERSQVRRLASGLNGLMDSMNLKEDVFYMGAYGSLVAGVLENSPVCLARRKVINIIGMVWNSQAVFI